MPERTATRPLPIATLLLAGMPDRLNLVRSQRKMNCGVWVGMGKRASAEFVEIDSIRDRLGELGVNDVQSYGVGHLQPIPNEAPAACVLRAKGR